MTRLYGSQPIFIFDPDDDSNRPLPGYHDNALAFWPIYPLHLRNLFTRAFTQGLRDPVNGRVRETEWRSALVPLRDALFYCSSCGAEISEEADVRKASSGKVARCWSCQHPVQPPLRLHIGKQVILLNHDTILYPHHIDDHKLYDFSSAVAAVSRHPTD